ncbi:MAG TPA: GatB/YqeY domain-containing protein [Halanaerobiales bacterium]|nr:GatB/YqeY domain-containing protein [Halanaerobiales bacterium]
MFFQNMEVLKISSIKEKLLEDMKTAMKKGEKDIVSVIRMVRAAVKNVEIEKRKDLDDQETIEVIAKELRQRKDSITEYEKVGKDKVVEDLEKEIEVLAEYLPEQLSREELEKIAEDKIEKTGAGSLADMGKVMGAIMPEIKGKADGREVNEIVKEKLE